MVNGIWQEEPEVIKEAAFDHFSSRFKEARSNRSCFSSSQFRKLSDHEACFMESYMSVEEIKEAVWGCANSKAPGPDGFNFKFIKTFWDIIKFEFQECIKNFETSGRLTNGCNPSFIVISKILANRLARVIDTVISPNQAAFIAGRQILNGIMVANEIIRMASIEDSKLLLFKVDFEKAFDSVNWSFLLDIMRQMGFDLKWGSWISSCLSSASISILVNGSSSKEFKLHREACDKGIYKGIFLVNNGVNLSLLCFELASGLKVNVDKSRVIGVGVLANEVISMASSLGCTHDSIPFFYLGLPVGKKMNSCNGWSAVINRFREKVTSWKANSLSIGGRLTLVKAVL
ncbi:putative RNA-directed DNA polymerase, eukaryota, reverse transcriptase zinc-binding domain protein, partial [Tanacetum coccineum]